MAAAAVRRRRVRTPVGRFFLAVYLTKGDLATAHPDASTGASILRHLTGVSRTVPSTTMAGPKGTAAAARGASRPFTPFRGAAVGPTVSPSSTTRVVSTGGVLRSGLAGTVGLGVICPTPRPTVPVEVRGIVGGRPRATAIGSGATARLSATFTTLFGSSSRTGPSLTAMRADRPRPAVASTPGRHG